MKKSNISTDITKLSFEESLEQFSRLFLIMAFTVALALGIFSEIILDVLATSSYSSSSTLVPIILIGTVFSSIYPFTPGLWLRGHTWRMASSSISISILGFALSYMLVPYAGSIGASVAYAFTGIFYALIMTGMSDHAYPVGRRYDLLLYASILFVICSVTIAWMLENEISILWRIAVALFSIVLISIFLLSSQERKKIIIMITSRFLK
jgi:O-antigen/teichoic acid export membrane protein